MELQHFSHEHPLVFTEECEHSDGKERAICTGCEDPIYGPTYRCIKCDFCLHKVCAELSPELNHPFDRNHSLTLQLGINNRFLYGCLHCGFIFQLTYDKIPKFLTSNYIEVEHSSHTHPLIFEEDGSVFFPVSPMYSYCYACKKEILGPLYSCRGCRFQLHKKCFELPLEINHPYHHKHPLHLLPDPPSDPTACHLCQNPLEGFVYHCSLCKIYLDLGCSVSPPPPVLETKSHDHPFILVTKVVSFVCDYCGTDGQSIPYICTVCSLMVHKDCILLPGTIQLTWHCHPLRHKYYILGNESKKMDCGICHDEVDKKHGSYSCLNCEYVLHVKCATDERIWDKTNELWTIAPHEAMSDIDFDKKNEAIEMEHLSHEHKLVLRKEAEYGKVCDGCILPIITPFYGCTQCDFFLHKTCAELPTEIRHFFHQHLLIITYAPYYGLDTFCCKACGHTRHGFAYYCRKCQFDIDIQCSLLSVILNHESHEHPLFFDHKCQGTCNACGNRTRVIGAYRCKQCGFTVDCRCINLPQTTEYKYDDHPLFLTYGADSDQHYCEICEEERDPMHWFDHCEDCDYSVHPDCVIGKYPYLKLGRTYHHIYNNEHNHPHPLTFVKKIWNCPRCKRCDELCRDVALECEESECHCIVHYACP